MFNPFKHEDNTEKLNDLQVQEAATVTDHDDYMQGLWHYDPEQPGLGMRPKEELEKIYKANDFAFVPGAYQAGELCFLAAFGERLVFSFASRLAELKQATPDPAPESLEAKQITDLDELVRVSGNRVRLVQHDLAKWLRDLSEIHYLRSRFTQQPYIDANGRVYVFTDPEAIAKATERASTDLDYELALLAPADLNQKLFLNGCELMIVNDAVLAFSGRREDLLGESAAEQAAADARISENNRALRYFSLGFLQVLQSPKEGDKQKVLQQLEAQISARLLQAQVYFKAQDTDGENTNFVVLSDGQGHKAIAAYTDQTSLPQNDQLKHVPMAFYPIAHRLHSDGGDVDGIILNPGEINFYLDQNWLGRLVRFAEQVAKAAAEKQAEGEKA